MQQWRNAYIPLSNLVFADSHKIQVSPLVRIVKELNTQENVSLYIDLYLVIGNLLPLCSNKWQRAMEHPSPRAPEPALSRTCRRPRNKSPRSEGVQTRKEIESFSREQAIWRGYVVNY
jgi:hypothetical protein